MIIMAVLAPVMIIALIATGAAMIAVLVTSAAAVGGVVVGVSDSAYRAVAGRRSTRRNATPPNMVAWPPPTAEAEPFAAYAPVPVVADPQAPPQRETAGALHAVSAADYREYADGFASWDEVFPFEEPDFEEVVTYTLVAGSDF
jgi:hypothetical protein